MGLWLLVGAMAVGAPALKDGRKPVDQPAGEWTVVRIEDEEGRGFTEKEFKMIEVRFVLKKNELWTLRGSSGGSYKKIAFYEKGRQTEVDFHPESPIRVGKGIVEVKGDEMVICASRPGKDRPTELTAPKGSDRVLIRLKRVDKDQPSPGR